MTLIQLHSIAAGAPGRLAKILLFLPWSADQRHTIQAAVQVARTSKEIGMTWCCMRCGISMSFIDDGIGPRGRYHSS